MFYIHLEQIIVQIIHNLQKYFSFIFQGKEFLLLFFYLLFIYLLIINKLKKICHKVLGGGGGGGGSSLWHHFLFSVFFLHVGHTKCLDLAEKKFKQWSGFVEIFFSRK